MKESFSYIYVLGIILLMCISLEVKSQCPSTLDFDVSGALCMNGDVLFDNISSSSPDGIFEFIVGNEKFFIAIVLVRSGAHGT